MVLLSLIAIGPLSAGGGTGSSQEATAGDATEVHAAAERLLRDRSAEATSRSMSRIMEEIPAESQSNAAESQSDAAAALPFLKEATEKEQAKETEQESEQQQEQQQKKEKKKKKKEKKEKKEKEKTRPEPVGDLNQRQMDHAAVIVRVGQDEGLPKRAQVVAIATALQESRLRNLASRVVPESLNHPHDGTGSDHDSVGLFQQRPSQGWGKVAQLMDPAYSARTFYRSLRQVGGWQDMPITAAAQAVQVSAYPNAYAKHEKLARRIVRAVK